MMNIMQAVYACMSICLRKQNFGVILTYILVCRAIWGYVLTCSCVEILKSIGLPPALLNSISFDLCIQG
jgi:hypothetical protein